jgi:hypothetical protein
MGDLATVAGSRLFALGLVSLAATLGCRGSLEPGGFEDDLDSGDAAPPDLPQSECDPWRFDGCEDGFKCSYVVDPELGPLNRCVALLGDALAGEPCETIGESDDCANHHLCWATDADGQAGECVSFCSGAGTCEDPLDTCSVSNDDLLPLCLPKCDPLVQDCSAGWGCYADDYKRWACDLDRSGDGGAHGQPCDCLNCCDPGLLCLPGVLVDAEGCGPEGAVGCCAQVCMLQEDVPPVEGACPGELEQCEPFYSSDSILMGYDDVGVCRL